MNRKVIYPISSALIVVFLLISGMSAWLLGTSDGASWLIKMISDKTGVEIKFTKIEGRLWNSVSLEGIRVHWHQGNAKAEKLSFEWRPLMMLTGTVMVNRLSVSQAMIQDNRPDKNEPPDLNWPHIRGLAARIDARIDRLEMEGFDYRRLEQTPFRGNALSALIVWHEGTISLRNLIVKAPDIAVSGTVEAGFLTPSLRADVVASPSHSVQGIERFSLKARLLQGHGREQLGGTVTVTGMAGDRQVASLSGRIGLTKTALDITQLEVKQEKRQGVLTGKGEIDFSSPTPVLHLSLDMEHLDLSPEIKMITDISGNLVVKGNPEEYEGSFTLANKGEQKHQADLAASFSGDKGKINLQTIKGSILGGTLAGRMQVSWTEGISLKSDLQARNMNPVLLNPEWNGVINMNLSAEVNKPDRGDFEAELNGSILESRLRGRELTGGMLLSVHGDTVLIDTLFLKGNGFAINVHGDLGKRLSFFADIRDLSGLVPDTEGRFYAEGWVSRKRDVFSGSVKVRGNNLIVGQAHIQDVSINAFLSESTGSAVRLKAEMKGLEYEKIRFRKAALELRGKPEFHDIKIALASPDSEFQAGLQGGYHKRTWHGKIVHLSYKDTVGRLDLASSADLYVSKDTLSLSPLIVKGPGEEALTLNGEVTTEPLRGFVQAEWQQLNLARGNRWLEPIAVSGHASGNVRVTWDKGSLTGIEMLSTASAALIAHKKTMGIKDARLQMRWNNNGLDASVFALFAGGGVLQATAASSSPAVLSFPRRGRIDANWKEFNLIMLNPFLPENIGLTGKASGALKSQWAKGELLSLAGKVHAQGTLVLDG
ncbi:MAG: hypothetical protein OEW04_03495, partial [Nitrospirota bacterium]|nr:hypothetical protein [Nitrospirota bacterium]